jgi:hypothetical protein
MPPAGLQLFISAVPVISYNGGRSLTAVHKTLTSEVLQ